jgi:1-acyl-sn-glycerol-3-phosphate acyltransferase
VSRRNEDRLRLLSRTERFSVSLAQFCRRWIPWLALAVSYFPMGALVWAGIGRRVRLTGLEYLTELPRDHSVLLVANHRSFFDFFVVLVTLRIRGHVLRPAFFPVRGRFFYSHLAGVLINLVGSGMSMFPPMFRTGRKRAVNAWSFACCAEILARPRMILGVHPESTRGRGPDPFELLPAQAGAGRIALSAPHAHILPVFVVGLGNRIPAEIALNLSAPRDHPVLVAIGPEVDLTDLRGSSDVDAAQRASDRMRSAIQAVGEGVREELDGA